MFLMKSTIFTIGAYISKVLVLYLNYSVIVNALDYKIYKQHLVVRINSSHKKILCLKKSGRWTGYEVKNGVLSRYKVSYLDIIRAALINNFEGQIVVGPLAQTDDMIDYVAVHAVILGIFTSFACCVQMLV